jgi:Protein of unknown function (DUF3768)
MTTLVPAKDRIRIWNDHLRKFHRGGQVLLTQGIASLDQMTQVEILKAVADFDAFTANNDPHGEHDCAILSVEGHRIMFKIDCYDGSMLYASEDPADPRKTIRVMTIMLTEEY